MNVLLTDKAPADCVENLQQLLMVSSDYQLAIPATPGAIQCLIFEASVYSHEATAPTEAVLWIPLLHFLKFAGRGGASRIWGWSCTLIIIAVAAKPSYSSNNGQLYLCNNEATGHAQTSFGSKMAGDHDTEPSFWKPELRGAGVHDLVHHHHRSTAVSLGGLNWGDWRDAIQIQKQKNKKTILWMNEWTVH